MTAYANLEISLHRREEGGYSVELRFSQPRSDADLRLIREGLAAAQFDLTRLRDAAYDPAEYGRLLTESLFNPEIRNAFGMARKIAQGMDSPLRVRLFVAPSAAELHSIHWEMLRDPEADGPLFTGDDVLFSRYLSSVDWRPVHLRAQHEMRCLAAIANPNDLESYGLQPLKVDEELQLARTGLQAIPLDTLEPLPSGGNDTLNQLQDRLRDGYDILYLVCHGALEGSEPWLWFEDREGKTRRVSGKELLAALDGLQQRPRLVVLSSCQSAGSAAGERQRGGGVLAALGPLLADAGIPAVVGMQGKVSLSTESVFMQTFFHELQRDGQIDRAAAAARAAVAGQKDNVDWWMPVLFMRLKDGRIWWYETGFSTRDEDEPFEGWEQLLDNIVDGHCTPILGWGLIESLVGSSQEIAEQWAREYEFPLASHMGADLPLVAQYVAVRRGDPYARNELVSYVRRQLRTRHGGPRAEEMRKMRIGDLLKEVGRQRRENDPHEPHNVLAHLPCPIYITSSRDDLLAEALLAAGKGPEQVFCPWDDQIRWPPSVYDKEPDFWPSNERPLVYHLFGSLRQPETMVLTQDDYFDYMIGATRNRQQIPEAVRQAHADTSILFLGFHLEDWSFRILLRSILNQEGDSRRRRFPHVAVQIDPEGAGAVDPKNARRYLERYFRGANINIYWGSVNDFVKDLRVQWNEHFGLDLLKARKEAA
jgi:CHAT domain-containing protein/SIR2-like protein